MSEIEIKYLAPYSDGVRDLCKNQKYEKYILMILERSDRLSSYRPFCLVDDQSKGECDFKDGQGNKYDAKLIFDKDQGASLGERKNDILKWFESMIFECEGYTIDNFRRKDNSWIDTTKLYSTIKKRVQSLKEDENGILFIPFPIVYDSEYEIYGQFATDPISIVCERLDEQGLVGGKRLYFVYPSMEMDKYCLRDKEGYREYILVPELAKYIRFSTSI